MKSVCILAALVSLSLLASPVVGQQKVSRSVMSFDISGVRLNMPYAEAKSLLAATYRCVDFGKDPTFKEALEDEVKRRHGESVFRWAGSGPSTLTCTGQDGEELKLEFAQEQSGPVVTALTFDVDPRRINKQAFVQRISTKFGRPTSGSPEFGSWCDGGYRCAGALVLIEGPIFAVDATGNVMKVLASRGSRAERVRKAAIQAAADRLAPKKANSGF